MEKSKYVENPGARRQIGAIWNSVACTHPLISRAAYLIMGVAQPQYCSILLNRQKRLIAA